MTDDIKYEGQAAADLGGPARTEAFKCRCCGAGLIFEPAGGKFVCEFCRSEYTKAELDESGASACSAAEEEADASFSSSMNDYQCPNCGAEVMADDSTVADSCPYCHTPIIASGRVSGQLRPHKVVPFEINREGAKSAFLSWAKKKWFVPTDFKSDEFIEQMQGIYYPFWVTDADATGELEVKATKVRRWSRGNTVYTETSHFLVSRRGELHFEDISTSAFRQGDKKMLEGILPYPSDKLIPFDSAYLTGFLAKKRDIDRSELTDEVRKRMQEYNRTLLYGTVRGYATTVVTNSDMRIHNSHWDYTLMPIWMLVYCGKKRNYTFALNGTTGKVYGETPIAPWKLALFGGGLFALLAVLMTLLGGLLL